VPFKATAYAAREAGGLIWIYMGAADKQPPFREFEFMTVPETNRTIVRRDMECNFLQVLEGGLDSSHVGILHADVSKKGRSAGPRDTTTGAPADAAVFNQNNPEIEVRETEFGFDYAAFRSAGARSGEVNVRVTPFVMPNMVMIPPGTHVIFYVPYDDTHCSWMVAYWSRQKAIDRESVLRFMGLDLPGVWVNDRLMSSRRNNFFQDRDAMASGSWSGLAGFTLEDGAMSLSAGAINDRTKEHLVPADVAVMRVRRLFLDSMRRVEAGDEPAGVAVSDSLQIKAAEGNVARSAWHDIVPGHRPPSKRMVPA
jgi:phthalate 4,5-dioxygenase